MAVLLILALIFISVCIYAWHHASYWSRRGLGGPPSVPFLGNLRQLGLSNNKPWPLTYHQWSKIYGKFYGIQKGHRNVLVISDPKMAHEVMNTKFDSFYERDLPPMSGNPDREQFAHQFLARGQNWRRLRALASPAFSNQSLKRILPIVEYCAEETIRLLEERASKGDAFNLAPFYHEFTADVIGRMALGRHETRQFENELTGALLNSLKKVENWWWFASWLVPALGTPFKHAHRLSAFFREFAFVKLVVAIQKVIAERKARRDAGVENDGSQQFDLIDQFLDAENNDIDVLTGGVYDKSNHNIQKKLTTNEIIGEYCYCHPPINSRGLLGQCIVFMFAGFDTTANTLAFTSYYLAKNQQVQDRLRAEIEEVCKSATPSYDELGRLKYSDAIMKETLRLHPIASTIISRKCTQDTTIGDGMRIEKGLDVQLDVLSLHTDPEIWGDDADQFRPERWLQSDGALASSFYGFGLGPRICAGMRLAYLEQKLLLVHIIRRFRIVPTVETGDSIDIVGFIMHPTHVTAKLELR